MHDSPSAKNTLILFSKSKDDSSKDVEVFITAGSRLAVRLGGQVLTSSADLSNIKNNWHYIAVNIINDGATARAEIFINGVDQTASLTPSARFATALASERMNRNFIGYATHGGVSHFNGMVDSFAIWGNALPLSTVQAHAKLYGADAPFSATGLIARYDFSETVGYNARGRTGTLAQEAHVAVLDFPNAVFAGGDFTGWTLCTGWGDPHWTDVYGHKFDTIHQPGYFDVLRCVDSAQKTAFQIMTWHATGCCWDGRTVVRAVQMRMGDTIVQWASSQARDAGISGPWVYKVVAAGVNPESVQWTSFTPSTNAMSIGSGIVVTVSGSTYTMYGAPFGYLVIHDSANYANLDVYSNENSCTAPIVNQAVCRGYSQAVGGWFYADTPTSVPITLPPPVAQPPPQTCDSPLIEIATESCKRCFPKWNIPDQQGGQETEYSMCIGDICLTGNPYCPPPVCVVGEPCCTCASTGTCVINSVDNSTSCSCDAGYAGKDCDQRATLYPLTLTTGTATQMYDNLPYYLNGHNLAVDGDIDVKVTPTAASLANANAWKLKNSLLAYVGYVETPSSGASLVQNSQHLYIIADASNGAVTHDITLTYSAGTQSPTTSDFGVIGAPNTVTVNTVGSVRIAANPSGISGFVIRDMKPAAGQTKWCVTLGTTANVQVGVGSGNIRGQLDILRVIGNSGHQICGEPIANPCAAIMDCDTCAANAQCGWCRTTGTCRLGRPAGPIDGSLCPAWAFTFDSVTRRITETYGYPVSPVDTTVVLGATTESLPIELKVDMAYRFYSAWDVQIMFPRSSGNNPELQGMQGKFSEIANFFTANYINTAVSFAAYGSRADPATAEANGDRNVYMPVFGLTIPTNVDGLQTLMNQVTLSSNAGVQTTLAIQRAAGTENPGWRNGARHLIIIFATHIDSTLGNTNAAKKALLDNDVFPVFIATSAVKSAYQTLVSNLGFGIVLDYNGYASIGTSIDRAMADASSSISVTVGEESGRINTALLNSHLASLTLTGLEQKMRARAVIPIHSGATNGDYAVLRVPAFGKAVIEAVPSDSPYTNGVPVTATVDSVLDPYTTLSSTGVLVYLTGKPADVLKSNAKVQAFVTDLTAQIGPGKIVQFNETALRLGAHPSTLPEIVPTSAGTAVTDVQGRVIYIPVDNAFNQNAAGAAFATITYFVRDECSPSPPGTLPIFIKYANNESPNTEHAAVNTNENQAVVVEFVGTDTRQHDLKAKITQVPKNTAGNPILSGSLYAFSQACWDAVSVDFKAVSTCGAALVDGAEIDSTTHVDSGNGVWTTTVRAIYVPAEYANSQGIPAVYKTTPEIAYKFIQKQGQFDVVLPFVPLETATKKFDVVVAPVNQAPYSKKETFMTNWLSWPVSYADIDPAACATVDQETGSKCVFDQNLGVEYPNLPASEALYVFGGDVDSAHLTVRITEVACPAAAQLDVMSTGQRVVAGMLIDQSAFVSNSWKSVIRFKPTQDGSGDPYCSFKYVVNDGLLDSAENQVVIAINFQPLPPRSENYRFFAPALEKTPFKVAARTVNDVFNGVTTNVFITKMTVTSCNGDLTSVLEIAGTTVNCASLPVVINVASNADDTDSSAGKEHAFTGFWTPTGNSVQGFSVQVTYEDSHTPTALVSAPYTISFSYRKVNQGPQLQFITGSQTVDDFGVDILNRVAVRLQGGSAGTSIGHNVTDKDIGEGEMVVRVHTIGGNTADLKATFIFTNNLVWSTTTEENGWVASGLMSTVVQELSALTLDINSDKETSFNVSITVEDGGATGACSETQVTPCNKIAKSLVVITTTKTANVTAIALAAGAGGAALAAAAAAAIAWRALREPPTESYNPWEMDDSTEGTVMNPLFEASTKSGNNAIYEPST